MLKGKLDGSYISRNGNKTFRYVVSGSKEEIAAYEAAQGENLRRNDAGQPLFFTTDGGNGFNIQLGISQDNNIYVDTTEIDVLAAIAEKHGLASEFIAQMIVAKCTQGTAARSTAAPVATPVEEKEEAAEEGLGEV